MDGWGSRAARAGLVLVVLTVLGTAVIGVAVATGSVDVAAPTVVAVESEWGSVTDGTTTIETTVVIENPNPVGVPAVLTVEYSLHMNDVTMAAGSRDRVGVSPGRTTVTLSTTMDNERIPAWWASHINRNEATQLTIRSAVRVPGFAYELPAQRQSLDTDILGPLNADEARSITAGGRTLLTMTGTRAAWGEASGERTPLVIEIDVENPSSSAVRFRALRVAMTMNGIAVGSGTTAGPVSIEPNAAESIVIVVTIENDRLRRWWASHLRAGERTQLALDVAAVTARGNATRELSLPAMSPTFTLETDILGGGPAAVQELPPEDGAAIEVPVVESVTSTWRPVDEETTRLVTTAAVHNHAEAGSPLVDLLAVDIGYRLRLNEVVLATSRATDRRLEAGENRIELADTVPGDRIQAWWVSHLLNDERTDVTVEPTAVADLGFVRFPVDLAATDDGFETDLLVSLNHPDERAVVVDGRTVLTVHDTASAWGDVTFGTSPIEVRMAATNPTAQPVTVTEIRYSVAMNGVELADGTDDDPTAFAPQRRTTLETTIPLDNSKTGRWWVTHVENGGTSELEIAIVVVVEWRGMTEAVPLEGIGGTSTVEIPIEVGM